MEFTDSKSYEEYWYPKVELWKKSGLSQAEFCRVHELTLHKFRYWLKKYSSQKAPQSLEPVGTNIVPLPFHLSSHLSYIGLVIGDRYALRIPDDFNENTLDRIISVLETH